MRTKAEQELRQKARDAVRRHSLPCRKPDHTWGGPGNGAECAVCGATLNSDDMVFDLEFTGDGVSQAANHQLHVRCFAAWEFERDCLRMSPDTPTLHDSDRNQTNSRSRQ
jgi:hypothetical protein